MSPLIQLKQTTSVFLVAFVVACFGLSPKAHAVLPAPTPDGGYPGDNTAEGFDALLSVTTGLNNTAIGWSSLKSITTGGNNTAVGSGALLNESTGSDNTAIGTDALQHNTASGNVAVGRNALIHNTSGNHNTVIGGSAATGIITGAYNTVLGNGAGANMTTGFNNTILGRTVGGQGAGDGVSNASDVICINAVGQNNSDSCYIGGIYSRQINAVNHYVGVDANGKLGTLASSRRYKRDIKSMGKASEAILALNPVSFHYKSDAKNTPCFGLIGEEVAEVNPDLVVRDDKGEIFTVRYDQVNAMLLNEFLKEHKIVQKQGATIARLQKQIETLTAGLQKVSAQLEVRKPAPQTALNNR
jgi:hypothetical protein